jgi:hypothetical protein
MILDTHPSGFVPIIKHEPTIITNLRISKDLACFLNTQNAILDDLIIIHVGYQSSNIKHFL